MSMREQVVRARGLKAGEAGLLTRFERDSVGWQWMSFSVRRLLPGNGMRSAVGRVPGEVGHRIARDRKANQRF